MENEREDGKERKGGGREGGRNYGRERKRYIETEIERGLWRFKK